MEENNQSMTDEVVQTTSEPESEVVIPMTETADQGVVPPEGVTPVSTAKPKKKRKFAENWLVLCVIAYCFILVGQILGSMFVNVPIGIVTGVRAASLGMTDPVEVASNISDFIPDWIYTGAMYFMFIGIWVFMLLMMLIPAYKPVYKAIGRKTKGNNILNFIIGLLIGFGMNGICILAAYLNEDIKLYFDSFRPVQLVIVLIAVFVQSSAEELVTRGFLYQMLIKTYKPWIAIVVNSLLFGALHLMNPGVSVLAIVDIVVTGILFSLMVYYMDSIWAAMAAHTAWNFCQNIIFGLLNSGQAMPFSIFKMDAGSARNSFAYNVDFGVEGTPLAVGIQIVVAIIIFVWGYTKKKKPTNIWADEQNAVPAEQVAAAE